MNMPPKEATTAAQVQTLTHLLNTLVHSIRPFQIAEEQVCDSIQDDGARASLEVALIDVGQRISLIATDPTRWTSEVDHEDAKFTKALQIEQLRYMQAQRRVAEMMEDKLRRGDDSPLDTNLIVGHIKPSDNKGL